MSNRNVYETFKINLIFFSKDDQIATFFFLRESGLIRHWKDLVKMDTSDWNLSHEIRQIGTSWWWRLFWLSCGWATGRGTADFQECFDFRIFRSERGFRGTTQTQRTRAKRRLFLIRPFC
jgi:hypothetical protein